MIEVVALGLGDARQRPQHDAVPALAEELAAVDHRDRRDEVRNVVRDVADRRRDDERRARFARLLECEDVDLLEWFTRRSQPEDPELRAFVAELLDRVAQKG